MSTQDPSPFLAEGEARLAAEDWDGASVAFRQAIAAAPSSALAHSKLGIAYVYKKQWEDAVGEFTRAIQLDPRYAPAYSNLGNVYRERGRLEDAVASYQKAITIDPEYWIAHQNLGIVYKQQGRLADAVREFKIATRLSVRSAGSREADGGPTGARGGRRLGCLGTGGVAIVLAAAGARLLR